MRWLECFSHSINSNYLPANEYDAYRKSSRMEFEGIGVEIQELKERITVVRVLRVVLLGVGYSPRRLVPEVDGEPVSGLSLQDTVARIKGVPGVPRLSLVFKGLGQN